MKTVIKCTDGSVAVMTLVDGEVNRYLFMRYSSEHPDADLPFQDAVAQNPQWKEDYLSTTLRKWGDANPGKYASHRDMEDSAIPTDREFRNAWTDTTPELVIDIDMAKARTIYLDRLRIKRDSELALLDIEALKAIEQGDTATLQTVAAQKQALRDLPETISADLEAAKTVGDLKAISVVTAIENAKLTTVTP